jgi:Transposase DNA-binding
MLATLGEAMMYSGLPDRRLGERLKTVVDSFIGQPGASIPQASGSVEAAKAAYRFFDNKRVTHKAIIGVQAEATWTRVKKEKPAVVIVAQDTTSLDYSSHKETSDLGVLDSPYSRGLFMHTELMISEQGVPWGLAGQQLWTRPVETLGKRHSRTQRVIEDNSLCKRRDGGEILEGKK